MAGGTTSSSKMVWTQVAEFPQSSVAVHVRVIFMPEGQLPEAVTSLKMTKGAVSQLSLAVAVPVLAGNVLPLHAMVTFGGHTMEGGTLSSTKMVWRQELEFPHASVAIQVRLMVSS